MTGTIARRSLGLGVLLAGAFALSGCLHGHGHGHHGRVVVVEGDHHGGPPAHAPAHGYRRKHGYHHTHRHKRPTPQPHVAVELRFDESLGVHVVVGHDGIYFHADHYYRLGDTGWEWSAQLGHAWVAAPDHGVPTGLRKLHGAKGPKKHKRSHPAKGRHGKAEPAPAKAESQAKAARPPKPKAKAKRKTRVAREHEDPVPEHRHRHVEHPGQGWN
jgi:hypothetical protein